MSFHRYLAIVMDDGEMVLGVEDLPNCWVFQGFANWHRGNVSMSGRGLTDEVINTVAERMRANGG